MYQALIRLARGLRQPVAREVGNEGGADGLKRSKGPMLRKQAISPQAWQFVRENYSHPPWADGFISQHDAAFLYEMLTAEQPTRVMEIGIASGVSTAFITKVLLSQVPHATLHSFDVSREFYADPTRHVGAYVTEAFRSQPKALSIYPGISSAQIRNVVNRAAKFDLAFIDANHKHPWPCIDLLSILDLIEPSRLVLLHDVNLPTLNPSYQVFGPNYLFYGWPAEKILPSQDLPNIGAIRLLPDPRDSARAVLECLPAPWQQDVADKEWNTARSVLSALDASLREQLEETLRRARESWARGAGRP